MVAEWWRCGGSLVAPWWQGDRQTLGHMSVLPAHLAWHGKMAWRGMAWRIPVPQASTLGCTCADPVTAAWSGMARLPLHCTMFPARTMSKPAGKHVPFLLRLIGQVQLSAPCPNVRAPSLPRCPVQVGHKRSTGRSNNQGPHTRQNACIQQGAQLGVAWYKPETKGPIGALQRHSCIAGHGTTTKGAQAQKLPATETTVYSARCVHYMVHQRVQPRSGLPHRQAMMYKPRPRLGLTKRPLEVDVIPLHCSHTNPFSGQQWVPAAARPGPSLCRQSGRSPWSCPPFLRGKEGGRLSLAAEAHMVIAMYASGKHATVACNRGNGLGHCRSPT